MDSSTGHRASSSRGSIALRLVGLIGAPLIWLALLQTNYVLAYPACRDRSHAWLHLPGAAAALASTAVLALAWRARPRSDSTGPERLLAETGLLTAALFALVVAATLLPPLLLQPCD
jgi:hypothetical protein